MHPLRLTNLTLDVHGSETRKAVHLRRRRPYEADEETSACSIWRRLHLSNVSGLPEHMEVSYFMTRLRLIVLSIMAILAVGAISASTASAAFELTATACTGTLDTLCYATTEKGATLFEFKGAEAFLATLEVGIETLLEANLGESLHITCLTATTEGGEFLQAEPLLARPTVDVSSIHFTGCEVLAPIGKKCKVVTPILTKALTGTLSTTEVGDVNFKPTVGTEFVGIVLENNGAEVCPATIRGTKPVTGEELCQLVSPEEALKLHTLKCAESEAEGNLLLLASQPTHFKLVLDVELDNATTDFWDLSLG